MPCTDVSCHDVTGAGNPKCRGPVNVAIDLLWPTACAHPRGRTLPLRLPHSQNGRPRRSPPTRETGPTTQRTHGCPDNARGDPRRKIGANRRSIGQGAPMAGKPTPSSHEPPHQWNQAPVTLIHRWREWLLGKHFTEHMEVMQAGLTALEPND